MKVFVLGHRGMLGHVVARFLNEQGHQVVTSSERYGARPRDPLIEAVRDSGAEWVVNALGRIKQKSEDPDDLFRANTLFPLQLALRMKPGQRLVHASTDCVFSGKLGSYALDGSRDCEDVYGLSKALGEAVAESDRCWVIRVSIIGPELGSGSGLMGWFLRQTGQVNGYTNHLWNGITTLEWAKICHELITSRLKPKRPVIQAGFSPALSKCDILQLMGQIWERPVQVRPVEATEKIDRTLAPTLLRPGLELQLRELKTWYSISENSERSGAVPAMH